jgi:UDP-glucose:(galactosyl)LPS alpha-1,2-glucosyltransferase
MNFLFATNDAFVPGLITELYSIAKNNPGPHRAYVMYEALSARSTKQIEKACKANDFQLKFSPIVNNPFGGAEFSSLPRYYSQSINRLLPQNFVDSDVHKILYLDTDIVVNGNLSSFYDLDISDKALAAVSIRQDGQDGGPYDDYERGVYDLLKIKLPSGVNYFNSGVLLMNVDYFRGITIDFYRNVLKEIKDQIVFCDQDILNAAFKTNALRYVDRRCNCTFANNARLRKGEYQWVKKNVKVLHFVVAKKPWQYGKYTNRLFHIYMHYYRLQNKPFSYLWKYDVWYCLKPFHFLAHCWRKGWSILLKKK